MTVNCGRLAAPKGEIEATESAQPRRLSFASSVRCRLTQRATVQ